MTKMKQIPLGCKVQVYHCILKEALLQVCKHSSAVTLMVQRCWTKLYPKVRLTPNQILLLKDRECRA